MQHQLGTSPVQRQERVRSVRSVALLAHSYSFRWVRIQDGHTSAVVLPAGVSALVRKAVFFCSILPAGLPVPVVAGLVLPPEITTQGVEQ